MKATASALVWIASLLLLGDPARAVPITYEVQRSLPYQDLCDLPGLPPCFTFTLSGTITTDGTLGSFGTENHILDVSLLLSVVLPDGTHSVILDQASDPQIGLSATAGGLLQIDATGPPSMGFFSTPPGAGEWGFCGVFRVVCFEVVSIGGLDLPAAVGPMPSGPVTLGVAVPEPATALEVAVGLALLAWRRGRRSSAWR